MGWAVTDLLPVLFVLICAVCAAVCLSATGGMRSMTEAFGKQVDEARRMLNALIDRLKS